MDVPEAASPSKRRRRPRRPPGKEPSLHERASQALRALRELGRALGAREGLGAGEPFPLERLVLPLSIWLGGSPQDPIDAEDAARLVRELGDRIGEALKSHGAFREGRVYCFWCDSPDCAHTQPENGIDTFSGYAATGKPEWQSFPNLCIHRGDTRLDLVYDTPPEIIAVVQDAYELKQRLLPGFGRGSLVYNVLGQVVVGLVPADLNVGRSTAPRVAMTFQVLETRNGVERRRLRLNILGVAWSDITAAAAEAPHGACAERVRRTVHSTRQRLESLSRRLAHAEHQGDRLELEEELEPLLDHLATDLERAFRLHAHRTQHAEHRHTSRERPTGNALGDARRATDDALWYDAEHDTIVVIGPRGRAHVFSVAGQHVTSLQLQPGELERKTHRLRWQPLGKVGADVFRENVLQHERRAAELATLRVNGRSRSETKMER